MFNFKSRKQQPRPIRDAVIAKIDEKIDQAELDYSISSSIIATTCEEDIASASNTCEATIKEARTIFHETCETAETKKYRTIGSAIETKNKRLDETKKIFVDDVLRSMI